MVAAYLRLARYAEAAASGGGPAQPHLPIDVELDSHTNHRHAVGLWTGHVDFKAKLPGVPPPPAPPAPPAPAGGIVSSAQHLDTAMMVGQERPAAQRGRSTTTGEQIPAGVRDVEDATTTTRHNATTTETTAAAAPSSSTVMLRRFDHSPAIAELHPMRALIRQVQQPSDCVLTLLEGAKPSPLCRHF
eukprot:COSAG05_NODE_1411_length_4958_cov_2.723400_3_plen_188_part_00